MEKLLIICDMFHCDMDSLVKGDMTLEDQADAAGYDRFMNSFSHRITGCVTLILAAVTLMAFLDGIVHEDILAIFLIAVEMCIRDRAGPAAIAFIRSSMPWALFICCFAGQEFRLQ